ncbi:MAG: sugar phosphate nucleotidyltransferase, partial [Rhodothermales bacterium]
MVAILLCAGFGTRLYPLTKNRPNALLDIAGKPVVDYQIEQLLELPDLREIHVVMNSRFASHFYSWWIEWRVRCEERGITLQLHNDGSIDDEHRLGEVGDLGFVLRRLDRASGAVVSAGDNIYRFSLTPIWDQFRSSDENLVLAFPETHRQVLQQHTVVEFDADRRLTAVHDQPQEPPAQWVCPRLYFLQPPALASVNEYLNAAG